MTRLSLSRWLRPQEKWCPMCGKNAVRSSGHPSFPLRHSEAGYVLKQLCAACRTAIPWIASLVCRVCGRPETCPDCPRRSSRHFSFCRSAVRYDERMRQLLALYKYRGDERLEPLMAAMLAAVYERICAELPKGAGGLSFDAVTPVPLASERLEERGFNQADRMAQTLAGWYGLPCLPLLQRVRHTEKQSLKDRRHRLADMRGNFSASASAFSVPESFVRQHGRPVRILLVDDIYTTGSTVNECAGALKTAISDTLGVPSEGVEICGALWARS